jgi:1-deoxy-D-xylulose-5-phosphate synthase
VRYPRGAGAGVTPVKAMTAQPWGKGEVRRRGKRIAILAFGTVLYPALDAGERLDATVANMRFVKPLDHDLVAELGRTHDAIVTVEEGCTMGGAGSAVMESLHAAGIVVPVLLLGLPDQFVEHGDPGKLMSMCGLDAAGIEASIVKRFGARPTAVRAVNQ